MVIPTSIPTSMPIIMIMVSTNHHHHHRTNHHHRTVPAGMAMGIESSSPSDGLGRLLVYCNSCSMSLGLRL